MAVGRRTVGRVMSRTVLWLMAAGAVVIAAALAVAWQGKLRDQVALGQAAKPAVAASPAPASPVEAPAPPATPPPSVAVPSFDIARIGPDGRAVIAGRAQPGAKIVLLDGGKEIAQGQADANGEWVIIAQDPPLSAGQHELRVIQHVQGRAPVTSDQVVVAIVPEQKPAATSTGPKEETLVMIAPSSGAPTLVQPPSAAGVPKSGDLVMSTLDYDEGGHVTVTGQATPGAVVRAYINDKMVAEGQAGADGRWRLKYDPGIAVPFRSGPGAGGDLWPVWDAIRCPALLLRGAESDLLRPGDAAEMARRGPQARIVEFPGIGHAPALMAPDQIAVIEDFLAAG